MVTAFALDDAFTLGVLSSGVHVAWALAAGGTLEDRPRYNKTRCFDPFPFPACDEGAKTRVRELGERLDAHRKRHQAEHPGLTLNEMYDVLEKLKKGEPLATRERDIHEQGLVSVLLEIHRALDEAVLDAYDWSRDLGDEAVLERLVALNRERAEEKRQGLVRWLRPEYQAARAGVARPVQEEMAVVPAAAAVAGVGSWPKRLPDQIQALRRLLDGAAAPIDVKLAAKNFKGAKRDRVEELLRTLVALGQARALPGQRFGC